jgi:hypothetical protein
VSILVITPSANLQSTSLEVSIWCNN